MREPVVASDLLESRAGHRGQFSRCSNERFAACSNRGPIGGLRHIHLVGCARDLHGAYLGLQPNSIRSARTTRMLLDPDVGRQNRWTTIERVPAWILRGEIVDVRLLQASRDVELNGCDPETEEHRACGQQRHDKDGTRDEEPLTKGGATARTLRPRRPWKGA